MSKVYRSPIIIDEPGPAIEFVVITDDEGVSVWRIARRLNGGRAVAERAGRAVMHQEPLPAEQPP